MLAAALGGLALAGCSITVRQSSLGGYRYMVEARGDSSHSQGDLLQAVHQQAAAICNGWRYEVVDGASGRQSGGYINNGRGFISSSGSVAIVIDCIPPRRTAPGDS